MNRYVELKLLISRFQNWALRSKMALIQTVTRRTKLGPFARIAADPPHHTGPSASCRCQYQPGGGGTAIAVGSFLVHRSPGSRTTQARRIVAWLLITLPGVVLSAKAETSMQLHAAEDGVGEGGITMV